MEMSDRAASPNPEFAAFVALDWGDRKHCWTLLAAAGGAAEKGELDSTPEAVAQWAATLASRFPAAPIAVAVEQQRGAVFYMLLRHANLVLFTVPPGMSAYYRRAFYPSGAKNDPGDTALLLDLLLHHRERLRRYVPDDETTRLLALLVQERRQTVDDKTRIVLRLTDCLKQYFPQILHWFRTPDSPLVADLLEKWPDLNKLQQTNPAKLATFFREHRCRKEERIQQRISEIYAAVAATADAAVIEACSRRALCMVKHLRVCWTSLAELEKRIGELAADHADAPIFRSLPGAGAATVPRLIAALGTQRDRFETAYQLQCYSGIAPVQEASGKTCLVRFRHACPKFLRQTFQEFAGQSIPHCGWAKAFYQQQLARGRSHHAAVRALAYKWIRIIFRCWKDRQPYDEQRYLNSLRRRGALLGAAFGQPTTAKWTSVAGFERFSGGPA
jgi:transposase